MVLILKLEVGISFVLGLVLVSVVLFEVSVVRMLMTSAAQSFPVVLLAATEQLSGVVMVVVVAVIVESSFSFILKPVSVVTLKSAVEESGGKGEGFGIYFRILIYLMVLSRLPVCLCQRIIVEGRAFFTIDRILSASCSLSW